ncbi:MAG: recombinase family protein [Hydrogeniiclostridium mannosilyticum]
MEARDRNIEIMKLEAGEKGFTIAGVSTDSSRKTPPVDRPGIQEMLAAVHEGKIGRVMIPSLSDLSLQPEKAIPVIAKLVRQGVPIYTKDTNTLSLPTLKAMYPRKKGGKERWTSLIPTAPCGYTAGAATKGWLS